MNQEMLNSLRRKFAEQSADLINKGGVDPLVLATLLLDVSVAVALHVGVPPAQVAESLRLHALKLEEPDGTWPGPIAHA